MRLEISIRAFVLCASSILYAPSARADTPPSAERPPPALTFVTVNPRLSGEGGVRTFESLGRLVFRYSDAISTGLGPDETTGPGKALAVLGRLLKLTFFDEPLAELEGTAIHEVFGHGARSRELHLNASYKFTLPGVYCFLLSNDCGSRGHTERPGYAKSVDGEIAIVSGGVEANYLTAHWINARVSEGGGRVRYDDTILYILSKIQYANSLLGMRRQASVDGGSNDIENYASLLADRANRYRASDRDAMASRLAVASLWNLADPMLWASAYGLLVRHVALGNRSWQLPMPHVLGATVLVVPRFNLSPFGAEHYIDTFVHEDQHEVTANAYVRVGSSGIGSYVGAGARLFKWRIQERLYGGAEADVWRQPELLFEERAVYNRRELWGWNAGASLEWRLRDRLGLLGRVAYKTRGHLMGQPLAEGVHGYVGLTLALDGPPSR